MVPGFNSVRDVAFTDKRTRVKDYFPVRLHFSYRSSIFFIIQVYLCDFISLTSFNIRNTVPSGKILVILSKKGGTFQIIRSF